MLRQQIEPNKLCLFNHIPKAGGNSLYSILKGILAQQAWWMINAEHPLEWLQISDGLITGVLDVEMIFGHIGYKNIAQFRERGGDFALAAFIREPISRVVSHYLYSVSPKYIHKNWFGKVFLSLKDFAKTSANYQTRFLIGGVESGEEAVARIKKEYDFIGFTEMFDFSTFWFLAAMGKDPIFPPQEKKNVTPSDLPERKTITEDAIEEIKQYFQIDIYVYETLLKEFRELVDGRDRELVKIWKQAQNMMVDTFVPATS